MNLEGRGAIEINAFMEARLEYLKQRREEIVGRLRGAETELAKCERDIAESKGIQLRAREQLVTLEASSALLELVDAEKKRLTEGKRHAPKT